MNWYPSSCFWSTCNWTCIVSNSPVQKTLVQVHYGLGGCHQNFGGGIPRHWGIEGWSLPHEIRQRWRYGGWWRKKVWSPASYRYTDSSDLMNLMFKICTLIQSPYIVDTIFKLNHFPQIRMMARVENQIKKTTVACLFCILCRMPFIPFPWPSRGAARPRCSKVTTTETNARPLVLKGCLGV